MNMQYHDGKCREAVLEAIKWSFDSLGISGSTNWGFDSHAPCLETAGTVWLPRSQDLACILRWTPTARLLARCTFPTATGLLGHQ